jgi:hypothetical protein
VGLCNNSSELQCASPYTKAISGTRLFALRQGGRVEKAY